MSLEQSAAYLKAHYALPLSVRAITDGVSRTVEDFYVHVVMPKPGASAFLEALRLHGVRMCIATATARHQAEAALVRCGLRQYFSEIFTCTQVGSGKDQPTIFQQAMAHLGTDRSNTMIFEDAWHAIQTAKRDGFLVAAVYDPHEPMQRRIRETTDVYLADFLSPEPFWEFALADRSAERQKEHAE